MDRKKYRNKAGIFLGILALMVVANCGGGSTNPAGGGVSGGVNSNCAFLGWIPYWDQASAVSSFKSNVNKVDYVSVFWYYLGTDGKIKKYQTAQEDKALVSYARQNDVKIFGIVANLPDDQVEPAGDWDAGRVGDVISDPQRMEAHIKDLVDLAERMSFDGINIDYEALPGSYRENFTHFIEHLSEALHAKNKQLAVALHPKTSENNPREDNGSWAQDWEALYPLVDQMHFMAYAEHTASSQPGPVASAEWVRRVMQYALSINGASRDKIFLGVPVYGQAWEQNSNGGYQGLKLDLTWQRIEQIKQNYAYTEQWHEASQSPHLTYQHENGQNRVVWFENRESISEKLKLAGQLDLCNIAVWRLGGEAAVMWDAFDERKNTSQ